MIIVRSRKSTFISKHTPFVIIPLEWIMTEGLCQEHAHRWDQIWTDWQRKELPVGETVLRGKGACNYHTYANDKLKVSNDFENEGSRRSKQTCQWDAKPTGMHTPNSNSSSSNSQSLSKSYIFHTIQIFNFVRSVVFTY